MSPPRRTKKTKAAAQRQHARARALERYGLEFSKNMHDEILSAIQQGKSKLVQRQSLRVVVHDVTVHDKSVRVIYDKHRKEIVTFLPADADPNPLIWES